MAKPEKRQSHTFGAGRNNLKSHRGGGLSETSSSERNRAIRGGALPYGIYESILRSLQLCHRVSQGRMIVRQLNGIQERPTTNEIKLLVPLTATGFISPFLSIKSIKPDNRHSSLILQKVNKVVFSGLSHPSWTFKATILCQTCTISFGFQAFLLKRIKCVS